MKPFLKFFWLLALGVGIAQAADDPLAPWRGAQVRPVSTNAGHHTIHSYFNTSPESPDGRWVLFFASSTPEGHHGELRIIERATGREKVIARNVTTEDAHRAACQQWVSGGRRVAFHDERGGEWVVDVVDVETGRERVLARHRQLCWGRPDADLVPIYSPHWNPGESRDLELLDVATGEIRKGVSADAVRAAYPEFIAKKFGGKPVSVFFPVLGPDFQRVFFKLATPAGGDARSSLASVRAGLVCYDLTAKRFTFLRESWGHPAWHPDGRSIIEAGNLLIDSNTGKERRIPGLPAFRGDHPSASPDGRLIVTDTTLEKFGGTAKEWGVVVFDARGTNHVFLHRFDNSRGALSWRRSHPHPAWSADGRRIYFNVSSGPWTQLHVAEAPARR